MHDDLGNISGQIPWASDTMLRLPRDFVVLNLPGGESDLKVHLEETCSSLDGCIIRLGRASQINSQPHFLERDNLFLTYILEESIAILHSPNDKQFSCHHHLSEW